MADNQYIPSALLFQDLERLKFSQNLRSNPTDYSAYVNERVEELSSEIYNRKRAAFQKAHVDMGRYIDMDHNANLYKTRASDVDRLMDNISANNARVQQTLAADRDVTRRQFEINEWYNNNKLETLFFLQIFFMLALVTAVVIFLQKNQSITSATAGLLMGLVVAIVIGLFVYRYYYTRRVRDTRLWNRRKFAPAAPYKPANQCENGTPSLDVKDIFPKEVVDCAVNAKGNFNAWQNNLENSMADYQNGVKNPSSLFGASGGICEKAD